MQIVSGSEVNTPASGGKMDGSAFRDAALAPGRVAGALDESVGGFVSKVGQDFQANRNARFALDADLQMRKTKDDFTANLAKMPDEGTWLPAWKEQVDNLRSTVLDNPHIGPDLQRQLTANFDRYQQSTTAEIRTAAMLKSAKETRETAIADSTYAAHAGDMEGALNALKVAVAHYAMSQAEADKHASRFPTIAAQAQADSIISSDPIHAPELIKKFEGTIEPRIFVGLQRTANDAMNRAHSQNLDGYAQDLDGSPDGTIDPKVLQKAVADNEITQRGANSLLSRMDRNAAAQRAQANRDRIDSDRSARDNMNSLMLRADDISYIDNPNAEKSISELKADGAALPAAMRRTLYEHIDAKQKSAKKTGETEENPVKRAIFDRMKEDREKNGLTIPLLASETKNYFSPNETKFEHYSGSLADLQKLDQKEVEEKFGAGVKKEDVLKSEQQHFANLNAKMRDWFQANPKATEADAETYRQSLVRPYILGATTKLLQKMNPVSLRGTDAERKSQYEDLPSGARILHTDKNGKTSVVTKP